MTFSNWLCRGLLAVVGCVAAVYVGQELVGGGALGWGLGGAIFAVFCRPLFKPLLERHARRREAYLKSK